MLILASASPRRREILTMLGYTYDVCPADADETLPSGIAPEEAVSVLSARKAAAVFADHPNDVVLGSDTIVVCEEEILGKPADAADAKRMLRLLSGRTHQVYTGVTLCGAAGQTTWVVQSDVTFRPLTDGEIDAYLATKEPNDKAGAYAIQGKGSALIERFDGDFFAIMGLPASSTVLKLREFGVNPV